MVLRHVEWLDTGSADARARWRAAEKRFRAAAAAHERRYGHDTALPAYNFTAAEIGMKHADRDEAMAWLARLLLAVLAAVFVLGTESGQRLLRGAPGSAALRALWLGMTGPWRVTSVTPRRADRTLVWVVPVAVLVLSRSAP
ncbi:Uncharacterised protein [Mycobacterium tuberculosis]|nr:Uncharacterised protein [Mycobacterium tuberculosis]